MKFVFLFFLRVSYNNSREFELKQATIQKWFQELMVQRLQIRANATRAKLAILDWGRWASQTAEMRFQVKSFRMSVGIEENWEDLQNASFFSAALGFSSQLRDSPLFQETYSGSTIKTLFFEKP